MNVSYIINKKRNRLNRCRKRLTSNDLTAERRMFITQRLQELEVELNKLKN
jgi:hypothetical protein